jgi:hypothetical protein
VGPQSPPNDASGGSTHEEKSHPEEEWQTLAVFWTDTDGADQARQTVYKQTESGVKKMKGVTYDVSANQVNKD